MEARLIECQPPDKTTWRPIGIVGLDCELTVGTIIDRLRARYPALCEYGMRVKRFDRIPGVFDDTDNVAPVGIIILDDSPDVAPIVAPAVIPV